MEYRNFFRWLEKAYRVKIDKKLQNALEEHFGENLNIYTDQDLYEQSRKIIQTYKQICVNKNTRKYYRYL